MKRKISTPAFRSREHFRSEEGSALIELALSLPMLCIMLLGAAEFARLAYASIEVTNAAHSAAIYAATSHGRVADTPGIGAAATQDSLNLGAAGAISVLSVDTFCQCSDGTTISCTDNQTCFTSNTHVITSVRVITQSSFSPMINMPGAKRHTFTLQGKSTQVVENQ